MHPQICVFTDNPPNPRQSKIITDITKAGFSPLVDSVHKEKEWFMKQFDTIRHRVFYNHPCLLHGVIKDIDFNIMGVPDFFVYYTTAADDSQNFEWGGIIQYFDWILNGNPMSDEVYENTVQLLDFPDSGELVGGTSFDQPENPLVVNRELENYFYGFQYKVIKEINVCLCQITKPFTERPFTYIITDYNERGYLPLFGDLFADSDWGSSYADILFLEKLWKKLDMPGVFDMDQILKDATESCYPNETCEIRATPKVYRKSIDELMESGDMGGIKL